MTTPVHIERFYPDEPGARGYEGHFQVATACQIVDQPGGKPPRLDRVIANLHNPQIGFGPRLHWVADVEGQTAGIAFAYFPEAENSHLVLPVITVHPHWRRKGVASAILSAMIPEFRARGRTVVEGWDLTQGGSGELWAHALGFQTVKTLVRQCLVTAEADRTRWGAEVPAGYRLERWVDSAPEKLITSVAVTRSAIHESPNGESDYERARWTPARVRESEAELREQGAVHRVVAAVHQASGEVVGLTEVRLKPEVPDWAFQNDTVVVKAHRGHGLGLCLKSSMARWILEDHPEVEQFHTGTSADNSHMIRINHELGYHDVRTIVVVNSDLASVEKVLAQRAGG